MSSATKAEINRALYGRSKYSNKKHRGYASKREANRAAELHLLEKVGAIKDLKEQVVIELVPKVEEQRPITWIADFTYFDTETGEEIWEDCKGYRTPIYLLKKKLVRWKYGKTIKET